MSFPSLSVDNVVGQQLAEQQRTTNDETELSVSPLLLIADNDVGGPIEDTCTAIQKMMDAGFHSDVDVNDEHIANTIPAKRLRVTPMIYFCRKGDLKMCRYLFVNGATCTRSGSDGFWFPMYAAASSCNLDVCKWLYEHGAKEDIRKRNKSDFSPLDGALCNIRNNNSTVSTTRWLLLNGGSSYRDDPSKIDKAVLNRALHRSYTITDKRAKLLLWVEEELKTHNHFFQFLSAKQQIFSGKSGILQHVADFAGVVRGKDLSILRQLANYLRVHIQDFPVGQFG